MKYILTLILIIFATDVFAQNVFNPVVIDDIIFPKRNKILACSPSCSIIL